MPSLANLQAVLLLFRKNESIGMGGIHFQRFQWAMSGQFMNRPPAECRQLHLFQSPKKSSQNPLTPTDCRDILRGGKYTGGRRQWVTPHFTPESTFITITFLPWKSNSDLCCVIPYTLLPYMRSRHHTDYSSVWCFFTCRGKQCSPATGKNITAGEHNSPLGRVPNKIRRRTPAW